MRPLTSTVARLSSQPLRRGGLLLVLALLLTAQYRFLFSGNGLETHEGPDLYLRTYEYAVEFSHGRLPQSFPDAVAGGGAAFPRFYPPLAYYLTAAVFGLTGDLVWATHLSLLLSVLFSGLSLAVVLSSLGVRPVAAAVAGYAYGTLPYRLTVVAVRGALAESWGLAWLPLLLAASWHLAQGERRKGQFLFPCALAALLLTHTIAALWAAPAVVLAAVAGGEGRAWDRARPLIRGTLGGVALAAWYLLPMLWYLPTVWASDPAALWATPEWFSFWTVPPEVLFGHEVFRFRAIGPMRLSHGYWGALVPVAVFLHVRRARPVPSGLGRLGVVSGFLWLLLVLVILAPGAIAPFLPQSLLYLQFPYRLIGLAGLLGAVCLAVVVSSPPRGTIRAGLFSVWAGTVALVAIMEGAVPLPSRPYRYDTLLENLNRDSTGLTANYEYFPRAASPAELASKVRTAAEQLEARGAWVHRRPADPAFRLQTQTDTTITLPLVSYDFIRILDRGGLPAPWTTDRGLVSLRLPPGDHELSVGRRLPLPYWIGAGVTLLGALTLLARYARTAPHGGDRIGRSAPAPVQGPR